MRHLLSDSNRSKPTKRGNKTGHWCGSLCVVAVLLFVVIIGLASYFSNNALTKASKNLMTNSNQQHSPPKKDENKIEMFEEGVTDDGKFDITSRTIIESDASKASAYYNVNGEDDIITEMPYLKKSSCSQSTSNCGFKQYSGYLLANENREIHYWFIEAEEEPKTKPVVFWTNGGPGCSGMDGLLTEHGAWRVDNDLTVHYNPYSWNNEVNMVYLEQPFGVGFSMVVDDDNVVAGDLNAADDMDAAIRNFITKFPEYAESDIFLTSESWGGHYVPITTYSILENNANGKTPHINFAGFMVGNAYTDYYENIYGFVGAIYGHGLLRLKDWNIWRTSCWNHPDAVEDDDNCYAVYVRAYYNAYNTNVYALDWPQCYEDEIWPDASSNQATDDVLRSNRWIKASHIHRNAKKFLAKVIKHPNYASLKMNIQKSKLVALHNDLANLLESKGTDIGARKPPRRADLYRRRRRMTADLWTDGYEPCTDYNMAQFLNLDEVQTALNVKAGVWSMCSDPVYYAWPDSDWETMAQEYYTKIIEKYATDLGLKLSIFSGDDDSVCGLQGSQFWLDRWSFEANPHIDWREWEDEETELGGYYTQYLDSDSNIVLHFITVRTAGHMVPTTEPSRALTILRKYLYEFDSA